MAKELRWVGTSKDDISGFPVDAKRAAGADLFQVQQGFEPKHWRAMPDIGPGVREIKIRLAAGQYRVFYVASFASAVYVLHAFKKATQKTEKSDIDLGKKRYAKAKADEQNEQRRQNR